MLLLVLSGCKKKKPNVPPPQQQAPTITVPEPQPQVQPPPVQPPQPQPQPPAATTTEPQPTAPTTTKPKPKPKKHHAAKKPPDKNKTVVKEGGEAAPSGQLSASIPPDAASHQRDTTAQLRLSTENNLKNITRQLSTDEQSMVQQIRTFLAQSRAADSDGDTERAYNLALKARLLSDELAKR